MFSLRFVIQALGPYIAVFKTHCDIVSDFSNDTIKELKKLSEKHDFLIFEDRKLVDIGNTVQKQYHGGILKLSEWAHFVNVSILGGPGIVEALSQTGLSDEVKALGDRGLLILAEMKSKGSLATGNYTQSSIDIARRFPEFAVGFVAMGSLTRTAHKSVPSPSEDFVVFTTGVDKSSKGDPLGQTYNTPSKAVAGGSDFIISGRGIYAAEDPIGAAKAYQSEGWQAYLDRVQKSTL